jgi:hypothetical protein
MLTIELSHATIIDIRDGHTHSFRCESIPEVSQEITQGLLPRASQLASAGPINFKRQTILVHHDPPYNHRGMAFILTPSFSCQQQKFFDGTFYTLIGPMGLLEPTGFNQTPCFPCKFGDFLRLQA